MHDDSKCIGKGDEIPNTEEGNRSFFNDVRLQSNVTMINFLIKILFQGINYIKVKGRSLLWLKKNRVFMNITQLGTSNKCVIRWISNVSPYIVNNKYVEQEVREILSSMQQFQITSRIIRHDQVKTTKTFSYAIECCKKTDIPLKVNLPRSTAMVE